MNKFWEAALKYNAPATIVGYVFYQLMHPLVKNEELIKGHPLITLFIIIIIFNFCAYFIYKFSQKNNGTPTKNTTIANNKLNDNEVEKSFQVVAPSNSEECVTIKDNEISRNKVKGDLIIGIKNKND